MGEKEKVDPQDPKEDEEIVPKEDGSIEVAIEETPEEEVAVEEKPEEKVPPPKPERDDKDRRENAIFYQLRQLQAKIENLEKQGIKPPEKLERKVEDLESELAKKPVSTIQDIVDARINAALEKERRENTYVTQFERTLNDSRLRVLKRHPELDDQSSIKSQIMLEVLNNRPDLVNNPYGPIVAMQEMEDLLEARGYKKEEAKAAPNRVPASSLPNSRNIPQTKSTVTLTKEDLEFCKEHNIEPKLYAQNRAKFSKGNASVEV